MLFGWTIASAICAGIPATLTLLNLREYQPPSANGAEQITPIAVIIPARNEAAGIAACVDCVLASVGVTVEVVVVDDASTDDTAAVVRRVAARDERVWLLEAGSLPEGWNGKQHACWLGANATSTSLLCFLDADVRLQPEALARMAALLVRERAGLVSGFPHEQTGTFLEKLLIPLIHFVLLGLLPMRGMRTTNKAAYAAGCGQFLLVDRAAYRASGGHAAIKATMHDGLLLPKLLRQHNYRTRVADLTRLAECRMYHSAGETWNGLAKNATEGMAAPARIVPISVLLALGQVAPALLLWLAWQSTSFVIPFLGPPIRIGMAPVWWAAAALVMSYLPRLINALRYRQSWLGALLHPVGISVLLVLQWYALGRSLAGVPATWKSREYRP
jgi:glycosyltransferase involved in cell wall biosynthesis